MRERTASFRAATWPAPRATTPRRPTACAPTATTPSTRSTARWRCCARTRGPGQHAQLIGGEVTLLGAEDHARALQAMLRHGRKPMSMTHGDFDYDYLEALALDPRHRPAALRAPRVRRPLRLAHVRPPRPAPPARRGRAEPLPPALLRHVRPPARRARRDELPRPQHDRHAAQHRRDPRRAAGRPRHGLSDVLLPARRLHRQRGPLEGRLRRLRQPTRSGGASSRAPARGCTTTPSRSATCAATAPPTASTSATATRPCSTRTTRATPAPCTTSSRRSAAWTSRTAARGLRAIRGARAIARHPAVLRSGARLGGAPGCTGSAACARSAAHARRRSPTSCTPSWTPATSSPPGSSAARRGRPTTRAIRATQERLQACSYAMAHPESGTLVPACAQHAVLDPLENRRLQELLALTRSS